jgi:hypothetical protein
VPVSGGLYAEQHELTRSFGAGDHTTCPKCGKVMSLSRRTPHSEHGGATSAKPSPAASADTRSSAAPTIAGCLINRPPQLPPERLCVPLPAENSKHRHRAERDKDDHHNLIPHRIGIAVAMASTDEA